MSSTSSIWQTKAALASGGIQYCSFCHGLSSFFSTPVAPFRARLAPYTPAQTVCQRGGEWSRRHAQMGQENTPKRSGELQPLRRSVVVGVHRGNADSRLRSNSARQTAGALAQWLLCLLP